MKIKKIITGILGAGVVSGIAYLAYKVGENEGRFNERHKNLMDDISDDEISFYDEPDEMCLSPKDEKREEVTMPEIKPEFAPLDSIHVDGVSASQLKTAIFSCIPKKFITVNTVRDLLDSDRSTAVSIIDAFQKAGYIGEENGNHRYPVYFTFNDYHAMTDSADSN